MDIQQIKWTSLPFYALYIKRDMEACKHQEDAIKVCHKYLIEYEYTDNTAKRFAIGSVILPLFEIITGKPYETLLK